MAQIKVIGFANENNSKAEKNVLKSLKKFPDNYYIIYGKMHITKDNGRSKDGETDFIVISPHSKILIIEVKGGGIERDGSDWFSVDRNNERHIINDPYAQSLKNKNIVIKELEDYEEGFKINFDYGIGHAVWFPDITLNENLSGMENGDIITLDITNLQNTEEKIKNILNWWCGRNREYQRNAREILNALCPKGIVRQKLGMIMGEEEEQICDATEEQKKALEGFTQNTRLVVKGCAGSGKTILATHIASKMAKNNQRVLLCCFNKHLAEHISQEINDQNIDILHFHELCRRIISRSGGILPQRGNDKDNYNNELLPNTAFDSLEKFKERYDAIIVDEGQDFQKDWWVVLEGLLKDEKNSKFFIFADDNQNIYQGKTYPEGMPVFPLTKNCRNTIKINEASLIFYRNNQDITPIPIRGAEGEVIFKKTNDNQIEQGLNDLVSKLINEGVNYHSITILTPRSRENTLLRNIQSIAGKRLVWGDENGIKVSSIASFKGLESDIVILVEIDNNTQNYNELMYVAITRAKHNLYILSQTNPLQ
ncbi:MAG: NERD domain-containing protein/DEAD/DEAH box helicase [Elusimicrobiales bacterium]|nr:NERD domain-containing protein/DEAD/DEAH box helicase [Elusimicrobiales bacterium]